jgi:ATP-dependent Clp protease ATP-binding subunit ClpA
MDPRTARLQNSVCKSTARLKKYQRMATPALIIPGDLQSRLSRLVIGQDEAIETILPFIQMHQAGLAPEGRPIGVILLLGPTGTGKTKVCEALAEVLHGSPKNLLKIDCGEFQLEHEVAKLIGSPPGYLGHRETVPMLNQAKLNHVASSSSPISLVLFDEIEKGANALNRLLLGIFDKALLRLGDGTEVNFQNSLIFLTSNLGAKTMAALVNHDFGLAAMTPTEAVSSSKLKKVGMSAVRQKFSPEFVNRIDSVVTFQALTREHCESILDLLLADLDHLIYTRLGPMAFHVVCTGKARDRLLDQGVSAEYGARELRRTVQRNLVQPLAALVSQGEVPPQSTVTLDASGDQFLLHVFV